MLRIGGRPARRLVGLQSATTFAALIRHAGLATVCVTVLVACPAWEDRNALLGTWAVDTDATVARARRDGLPARAEAEIREVFSGGRLEITETQLILRVSGVAGSESLNYTAGPPRDGCYALTIMQSPKTHAYCVSGDVLTVKDPDAPIALVYTRG